VSYKREASGLSEDELAQAGLSSLILLDETYSGLVLARVSLTTEILAIREQEPIAEVWTRLLGKIHSEASPRLKKIDPSRESRNDDLRIVVPTKPT